MLEPTLNDGEAYVPGHSEETARHLFELADKAGVDPSRIVTSSHGFVVPAEILEDGEDAGDAEDANPVFDPQDHTVVEVKEYLEQADEVERQRVLDAEASSDKPRVGLLKEGDK